MYNAAFRYLTCHMAYCRWHVVLYFIYLTCHMAYIHVLYYTADGRWHVDGMLFHI